MGEVYRARDTRLDRSVAIKVVSSEFAQRFEREAKTISQLNHPHICTLYDVGPNYLVMELLEGESLADRLAKGPLPLEQVLRYGTQIAEALDKAHRQGVVHRDVKPGNIMITKSGAKLLDFGLARDTAVAPLAGSTVQKPLTEEGTILGTFQYMAPEQLEGLPADARTDIFALGAILYEMTTGKRAFGGKSKASLIANILGGEPPAISMIQPAAPAALDRVIRVCLQKDPDERWQSAHDVAIELRAVGEETEPRAHRAQSLLWIAPLVAAVIAAGATWLALRPHKEPPSVVASSLLPPDGAPFAFDLGGAPAISPDGKRIAFVAGAGVTPMLYVRPLSSNGAQALSGTEGASMPFWSPDSRWLGFFAAGKLKKIDTLGGPPETLADAPVPRGGTWAGAVIVFGPANTRPLFKIAENGGTPTVVTRMESGETNHRFPVFLPDGKHFIYQILRYGGSALPGGIMCVGSIDGDLKKALGEAQSNAVYARTGHLVYMRERSLIAQEFDAKTLTAGSKITAVADMVGRSRLGVGLFSISDEGTLIYDAGDFFDKSHLQWLDATGKVLNDYQRFQDFRSPSLSHDQKRVAISVLDPATAHTDIWVMDLVRGGATRLTFGAANKFVPIWSPDDSMIVYGSSAMSAGDLVMKRSSGTGPEETLYATSDFKVPYDWSPDGRTIVFQNQTPQTNWDLWLYSFADHGVRPFVQTPASELDPKFSPDGRWIAYQSDESSRVEIFVLPVSGGHGKWQISTDGGHSAHWSRDGTKLFYIGANQMLMSVDVSSHGDEFVAGVPRPLFKINPARSPGTQYDVSADGKRFLVNTAADPTQNPPLTLVQNWTAKLK